MLALLGGNTFNIYKTLTWSKYDMCMVLTWQRRESIFFLTQVSYLFWTLPLRDRSCF